MSSKDDHYLGQELAALMGSDATVFEFLENRSLDGIWYWDLKNPENEWMSDRMWQVFGYGPDEKPHLASAWQDMINAEDLKIALANVAAHCADPSHPYDQEVRYTHKEGHTVWIRCWGMVIRDDEGTPIRMLGAHQDITERKRAEATLQQNNDALVRANADLRRFAFAASHNIRSPAVTLQALLSRLQQRHSEHIDDEGQELLSMARRQAERMGDMVDRMVDYAKVTREEVQLAPVDVADIVSDVLERLRDVLSNSNALVSVTAMPTVVADRALLRIALQSLVDNALTYNTSAEPRVDISAEHQGDRWTLSVADNGIGIADEHRERIFSVFERLHRGDDYRGAGLGLATCARVAAAHNGHVQVAENPTKGTLFTLDMAVNPQG